MRKLYQRSSSAAFIFTAALLAVVTNTTLVAGGCGQKPNNNSSYVTIDASTGQIIKGTNYYHPGGIIEVIVVNKNPYKYKYDIKLTATRRPEKAIGQFLRAIPVLSQSLTELGLIEGTDAVNTEDAKMAVATNRQPQAPSGCKPSLIQSYKSILGDTDKLIKEYNNIIKIEQEIQNKLNLLLNDYNLFIKNTQPDVIDCKKIVKQTSTLRPKLATPDPEGVIEELKETTKKMKNKLASIKQRIGSLDIPLDKSECARAFRDNGQYGARLAEIKLMITGVDHHLKVISTNLAKMSGSIEAMKELAALMASVEADQHAFVHRDNFPLLRGPHFLNIAVSRKNMRVKDSKLEEVCNHRLENGRLRFTLSAGFVYSGLETRTAARQVAKNENVANTEPATENRFGYEEDSGSTFFPALQLNGRFWEAKKHDLGLSLSLGARLDTLGDGERPEYLLGVSMELIQSNLFITLAGHRGYRDALAGGFQVGDPVPADLAEIPLTSEAVVSLSLGVTYKIR